MSEAYGNRGWAYLQTGKYELAILDFTTAMGNYENKPKQLTALYGGRADAELKLKKYKNAINDFSFVLKVQPDFKNAYWSRAACYGDNGDYQLAYEDYNKAIPYYKGDNKSLSRLYDERARMELMLQQYQKAIADDSLSISLDNQFGYAYWNKANAHAQNADFQLSIDGYTTTMSFYKNEKGAMAVLYNSIADEEYFLNDYQKVIDASNSAIALDTKSWVAYFSRGRAYLKK